MPPKLVVSSSFWSMVQRKHLIYVFNVYLHEQFPYRSGFEPFFLQNRGIILQSRGPSTNTHVSNASSEFISKTISRFYWPLLLSLWLDPLQRFYFAFFIDLCCFLFDLILFSISPWSKSQSGLTRFCSHHSSCLEIHQPEGFSLLNVADKNALTSLWSIYCLLSRNKHKQQTFDGFP